MKKDIKNMLEVYFIAGSQDCPNRQLLDVLEEALQSGITCYQFREKGSGSLEHDPVELINLAKKCRLLCKQYGVPFIVNDHLELAEQLKADGVHVGQSDVPIENVIEQLGQDYIIGLSTNNLSEYRAAGKVEGIDYVGIGPAFIPRSKADHEAVIGLEGIAEAMSQSTGLPAVAIGGITVSNVKEVWETGVDGVAVVSAISQSFEIEKTVTQLKKAKETK